MNPDMLMLTENQISQAFKQRDTHLLEKETIFVLNHLILTLTDVYSDVLNFIKPMGVKLKKDPDFIFQEKYFFSIKKMLVLIDQISHKTIDFIEAKLFFDSWFYEVTAEGYLVYEYNPEMLVPISHAAKELGVSRTMIYKYIDRGLETVGEKGCQKIPKFILDAWENHTHSLQLQWIYQLKQVRCQTIDQKLESVNKKIGEFEGKYGGTFYRLFGHLSDQEIDGMQEAVDIYDWKELELEKKQLLDQLRRKDFLG